MDRTMKTKQIIAAGQETNKALSSAFKGNNKRIAQQASDLCQEWAMVNRTNLDSKDSKTCKKECKKYVKDNIEPVGSIFIMIITGIIVKLIVDWIVNNFIYNLKK
jgi:hypothetical protein